jgi:hypothetical protein
MALSSVFTSQRKIYNKFDFSELKEFVLAINNNDWPFLTSDFEISNFYSIPKNFTKYTLSKFKCSLRYCEFNDSTLLFMFKYGAIPMTINLLNRNLDWVSEYLKNDKSAKLFPEHFRKKCS